MQFNPACLNQGGVSVGTNPSPVAGPHPLSHHHPPPLPQQTQTNIHADYISQQQSNLVAPPSYSDAQTANAWSNSIINALPLQPLYGIFNSSLVAVPTEGSTFNIPVVSQQVNDPKKKSPQKRPQGMKEGDELSPKADDKNQGLDDEQKMKRQRRLLKNREAAQQFRQRQKEYIQNLERKVSDLNAVVQENHKHIELINTENRLLRDQLVYLYNVMRQNLSLSSPTSPAPHTPQAFSPISSLQQANVPPPPPSAPPPGTMDLGLAFKSFGMLENTAFEEMLKNSTNPAPAPTQSIASSLSVMIPSPVPISNPPSLNPTPNQSPMPSPCSTPRISADISALSLSKEPDLDALQSNPLLMRYTTSNIMKVGENEAQTVPELGVKNEGGGGM